MAGMAFSLSPNPFDGSAIGPATWRCLSTISRAMKRCMISLLPSKILLMRKSRSMRSTPIPSSPRAASDCSVS